MEIESRGIPPYRVSSGIVEDVPESPEHWSSTPTFLMALKIMFDLTTGGTNMLMRGARVVDAEGKTVFTIDEPFDVRLLRQINKEGLNNLKVK